MYLFKIKWWSIILDNGWSSVFAYWNLVEKQKNAFNFNDNTCVGDPETFLDGAGAGPEPVKETYKKGSQKSGAGLFKRESELRAVEKMGWISNTPITTWF